MQHGGFGDEDGVVPGLESESAGQCLLGFGVEFAFLFSVLSVLSLFTMQSLLKHLCMYSSRWSRSLDIIVRFLSG